MPDGNVLEMDMNPILAKRVLNEIIQADNGQVFFTNHANVRMRERGITFKQVLGCLKHGKFFEEPYWSGKKIGK